MSGIILIISLGQDRFGESAGIREDFGRVFGEFARYQNALSRRAHKAHLKPSSRSYKNRHYAAANVPKAVLRWNLILMPERNRSTDSITSNIIA